MSESINETPTRGSRRDALPGIKALLLGAFVLFILIKLIYWLPRDLHGRGINEWTYTDWLIDYSAGFVRRGLSGELVRSLATFAPPVVVVGLLTWSLFCAVAATYLWWVGRSLDRLNPLALFGLLFLPSLLPFYLHDHGTLGRKEMIGFLILSWHLRLLSRPGNEKSATYLKRILPISTLALPLHLFIHEASFFQFLPVHLLVSHAIIRSDASVNFVRRRLILVLVYSPVFLACLAVIRYGRPTFETAAAICRHWELLGALPAGSSDVTGQDPTWALPGAITGLPWSIYQGTSLSLELPRRVVFYWVWLLAVLGFFTAWIGSMATTALAGDQAARRPAWRALTAVPSRRIIGKYFVLPFLASLPLYFLGWDFGRWFAVTCFNYVLIVLSKEVLDAELKFACGSATGIVADPTPVSPVGFCVKLAILLLIVCFLRLPSFNNEGANMFVWPFDSLFGKLPGLWWR